MITVGGHYTRNAASLRDLMPGDKVKVAVANETTGDYEIIGVVRGHSRNLAVGSVVISADGEICRWIKTIDVLELAPRGPSWAGARLVADDDGDPWRLRSDGLYVTRGGTETADDLERNYGPITVLLDADGRIPVDSVLKVNGVTREDLAQALHAEHICTWDDTEQGVNAVLTTLGGKS